MNNLSLNKIRELFLDFYKSKDHFVRDSFSLIPEEDKSLLIINSGMAPLKSYFSGVKTPPSKKMATCQKCIRTADIENVGKTSRHGTFFEMLGSFSFGDYFKEQSITWGWEFVKDVLKLPENRLWVTVYEKDDEAYDIWSKKIGFQKEKIVKLGKEDNFWEIGTGPCGPCSEIYFDRGEKYGCENPNCKPGCDCDRYIEFWNHVFTQYNRLEDGTYENLEHPNIDTGMGLERISAIMQETTSIFDVDTIKNILDEVCRLSNIEYFDGEKESDISIRIITDHSRSAVFMISDGITPSNEGRGYVLRRLIRRAVRHGRKLGIEGAFMNVLVDKVIENSETAYPSIKEQELFIKKIIEQEEERFSKTLSQGLDIIEAHIKELKLSGKNKISGDFAFKLHDTYGFPFEITQEISEENDVLAIREDFEEFMKAQKARGKKDAEDKDFAWEKDEIDLSGVEKTIFTGYSSSNEEAKLIEIICNGKLSDVATSDNTILIFDKTPFYATSGGQKNDIGNVYFKDGYAKVISVEKKDEIYLHVVDIKKGVLKKNDTVNLEVDVINRNNTMRNHSCTHLLHQALRDVLGNHVKQAGSFVDSNLLRFDFSHFEGLCKEDILKIEEIVNEKIDSFLPVVKEEMAIIEAESRGALGLFADKYKDEVRVVSMGKYSMELCGGLHVNNTGEIGGLKILSESGIASGIRRIEAITGKALRDYANAKDNLLIKAAEKLKTKEDNLINKLEYILDDLKKAEAEIKAYKSEIRKNESEELIKNAEKINGIRVIKKHFNGYEVNNLKSLSDDIRSKIENVLIVFISSIEDKHTLIVSLSSDLKDKLSAGKLVKILAPIADGKGGGKLDMAQAGLKSPDKIEELLSEVDKLI